MTYIPKNHPVRFLIESAANGRKLTAEDLEILNNANLPTGESLTAYKASVDAAARRVAQTGAGGNRQEALTLAESEWSGIAAGMSQDQRTIDTTAGPDDEQAINNMVTSIFDN